MTALPSPVSEKPAGLHFHKLRISGRLIQPRLEFTLESLPIERVDEPVSRDFYSRVFDPAKDDAF